MGIGAGSSNTAMGSGQNAPALTGDAIRMPVSQMTAVPSIAQLFPMMAQQYASQNPISQAGAGRYINAMINPQVYQAPLQSDYFSAYTPPAEVASTPTKGRGRAKSSLI